MKRITYKNPENSAKNNTTLQASLDEFMRYQTANGNPQTTKTYGNSLRVFCYWLIDKFGTTDIEVSMFNTAEPINDYLIWLREVRGNGDVTVSFHKRHLRIFLYWLMDRGQIPEYRIIIKNTQETVPETFTDKELEKLTKKPDDKADFAEYRNWVIVNLLLCTGCRRATLVGYRISNADLDEGWLVLNNTKSKKAQRMALHKRIIPILTDYIQFLYSSGLTADDALFPTRDGGFMTPNSLTHSMNTYIKDRKVEKTGVHIFRHTFAKNWIKSGGDSLTLQRMLGHSSLTMTEKYVRLFGDDMRQFVNKYSPIGKVGGQARGELNQRMKERQKGRH